MSGSRSIDVNNETISLPRVLLAEGSIAIYSFLLSELARHEHGSFSISCFLASLRSTASAANLGADLHRALSGRGAVLPETFVASTATASFALLALTNLMEGNYISSAMSLSGAAVGVVMMRIAHGEAGFKAITDELFHSPVNAPRKVFNGIVNFFCRAKQNENEFDIERETKKNR